MNEKAQTVGDTNDSRGHASVSAGTSRSIVDSKSELDENEETKSELDENEETIHPPALFASGVTSSAVLAFSTPAARIEKDHPLFDKPNWTTWLA